MPFHSPSTIHVSDVHIYIKDLDKSLHFYQQVLGFSVLEKRKTKAVLTVDGVHPIITLEVPNPIVERNPRSTGLYHLAILLPNRDDLAAFVLHLIRSKIPFGSSDHLVSEAIYFSDPEQNGIEVYVDRDPSLWTWRQGQVHMTVDEIDYAQLLKDKDTLSLWRDAPKNTTLGHIHLHVKDLKETAQFYTDGLGFKIVSSLGNQALFISSGGYHHHIGLNTWQGVGAPAKNTQSVGLHQFVIKYPSVKERDETVLRLQSMGYTVNKYQQDYLVMDPSKNQMVLSISK